jgi:hypothetical protein
MAEARDRIRDLVTEAIREQHVEEQLDAIFADLVERIDADPELRREVVRSALRSTIMSLSYEASSSHHGEPHLRGVDAQTAPAGLPRWLAHDRYPVLNLRQYRPSPRNSPGQHPEERDRRLPLPGLPLRQPARGQRAPRRVCRDAQAWLDRLKEMMVLSSTKLDDLLVELIESHADRVRVLELIAEHRDAENKRHERRFREIEAEWVDRSQALEAEVERLRAALQGIADNPDPLEGKCYCRWSQGVARQALGRDKDG